MATDWMGDSDLMMFYQRLAQIEQLREIDPVEYRRQYELLMQDYPGMIEQMQGNLKAGQTMMAEGFQAPSMIRGPAQNPFARDIPNYGQAAANFGKILIGGKQAREAEEGIQTQRDLQREEKIKTAQASDPNMMLQGAIANGLRYGTNDALSPEARQPNESYADWQRRLLRMSRT